MPTWKQYEEDDIAFHSSLHSEIENVFLLNALPINASMQMCFSLCAASDSAGGNLMTHSQTRRHVQEAQSQFHIFSWLRTYLGEYFDFASLLSSVYSCWGGAIRFDDPRRLPSSAQQQWIDTCKPNRIAQCRRTSLQPSSHATVIALIP